MRNKNKGIVILGTGGHAKVIKDIIESITTYSISTRGKLWVKQCVPWRDSLCTAISSGDKFIVGFGALDNIKKRWECFKSLKDLGCIPITLISPHAVVSPYAEIEEGTVVMPRAVIGPGVRIGPNCIINTGAIIEHDSTIGGNCHISTGAIVNGGCGIFDNVLVGSGAVIKQGVTVFHDNIIGAGAVVVKNIAGKGNTYVGCPAEPLYDYCKSKKHYVSPWRLA